MNKEQIQKQLQEVDEAFDSIGNKENRQDCRMYDGIVDIDRYLSIFRKFPQILWILKEAHDGRTPGGGWSITEDVLACVEKGRTNRRLPQLPMLLTPYLTIF